MRHAYWVWGRVRQRTSPYGVGGETGYTAQEDVKSINSYNTGEGRTIRVWFFPSCIPRPSLVLSALLSLGRHNPLSLHHWIFPLFLIVPITYKKKKKKKKRPSCASNPFQFSSHFSNPLLELLPLSLLSFSVESNPPELLPHYSTTVLCRTSITSRLPNLMVQSQSSSYTASESLDKAWPSLLCEIF